MPDRPNVILLCVDQMRYDCLSIAGHPAVETPHLDWLASRGVRFTNAHTSVASCIAARAALLTGLSQRTHGRVAYEDGVEWRYGTTLAGEMARAGYQSVAVGKMHVYPARHPMGFERVVLHDGMLHWYGQHRESDYEDWLHRTAGDDCGMFGHGLGANSWVARPWHLEEWQHPTYWATSRAVEFLHTRDHQRPFFLFLSYLAPHPPLVPPDCYLQQYLRQDLPVPPVGDWMGRFGMDAEAGRWDPNTGFGRLDKRAQHRAQAGYYGLITQLDHQVGRLIEHLLELRLLKNTVILFVSDHGELLGDHHFFRKQLPLAGSVRVPMFVSGPESLGLKPGSTDDRLVELRDVMPTLLEAAGAPVPPSVEGVSVLPGARGQSGPWRTHLHGEHAQGKLSSHYIADGRYRYAWFSQTGIELLFDTVEDPQELHNLIASPAHKEVADRLRGLLVRELAGREEGFTDGQRLIVGRPVQGVLSHVRR